MVDLWSAASRACCLVSATISLRHRPSVTDRARRGAALLNTGVPSMLISAPRYVTDAVMQILPGIDGEDARKIVGDPY